MAIFKMSKRKGSSDYIECKGDIKAFLTMHDPLLVGPIPKTNARHIINDDDKTAFDLWQYLEDTYSVSNAQAIQNLRNQLEAMKYVESSDWDAHLEKFNLFVSKISLYDNEISKNEKIEKLICTLPESFASTTMTSSLRAGTATRITICLRRHTLVSAARIFAGTGGQVVNDLIKAQENFKHAIIAKRQAISSYSAVSVKQTGQEKATYISREPGGAARKHIQGTTATIIRI
eukprot:IDg9789t1